MSGPSLVARLSRKTARLSRETRHLREWLAVLRENDTEVTWRTWARMVTGAVQMVLRPVGRAEFVRRARVCVRCPVFDRELRRCRGPWVGGKPTGCGCYLPWFLRIRRPYARGCWGREVVGGDFGWENEKPRG